MRGRAGIPVMRRVRRRFIAVAMGSVTAVLTVIIVGINIFNYVEMTHSIDLRIDYITLCAGNFECISGGAEKKKAPEFKERLKSYGLTVESTYELRYFTAVLDGSGNVLSSDTENVAAVEQADAEGLLLRAWDQATRRGFVDTFRYQMTPVSELEAEDAHNLPEGSTFAVFLDCAGDLRKSEQYLVVSLTVGTCGLAVVFLLVVVLSRTALRPVEESYRKQRRFVTDASHEIKTPLAVIDASNEVIELENGASEWTGSIHEQVERLTHLTERLVMLSRMDEGDALTLVDIDLSDTVALACEPFFMLAASRNTTLVTGIAPHVRIRGDATALAQVAGLLLDNATRYASPGATIRLELKMESRNAVLSVSNPADTMPEGSLDQLFERFYRPDSSRSSHTGGSGVGLSIVRAVAEAHGGSATAQAADGIVTFTVRLPR